MEENLKDLIRCHLKLAKETRKNILEALESLSDEYKNFKPVSAGNGDFLSMLRNSYNITLAKIEALVEVFGMDAYIDPTSRNDCFDGKRNDVEIWIPGKDGSNKIIIKVG